MMTISPHCRSSVYDSVSSVNKSIQVNDWMSISSRISSPEVLAHIPLRPIVLYPISIDVPYISDKR